MNNHLIITVVYVLPKKLPSAYTVIRIIVVFASKKLEMVELLRTENQSDKKLAHSQLISLQGESCTI